MPKQLSEQEQKLISRLNRVKGQMAGVVRMLEAGEDSKKISVQISAIVSGVDGIKETFLKVRLLEETMKSISDVMDKINTKN